MLLAPMRAPMLLAPMLLLPMHGGGCFSKGQMSYQNAPVFVFVQAGALAAFLKDMLLADTPYVEGVQADFTQCMEIHFQVTAVGSVGVGCRNTHTLW